ncbi:MAG TPA: Trm112 family protein, partial [Azospira sp.]|nr:Trm112 family protein [Azospira sp.]
KGNLEHRKAEQELVCKPCKLAYPIRDDIPVMLVDEARQLAAEA